MVRLGALVKLYPATSPITRLQIWLSTLTPVLGGFQLKVCKQWHCSPRAAHIGARPSIRRPWSRLFVDTWPSVHSTTLTAWTLQDALCLRWHTHQHDYSPIYTSILWPFKDQGQGIALCKLLILILLPQLGSLTRFLLRRGASWHRFDYSSMIDIIHPPILSCSTDWARPSHWTLNIRAVTCSSSSDNPPHFLIHKSWHQFDY